MFFSLAWADKATASRDLSGAAAQVHYPDGSAKWQSLYDSLWFMDESDFLPLSFIFVTVVHPRGEARAHLAAGAWLILVDISGVRQINK